MGMPIGVQAQAVLEEQTLIEDEAGDVQLSSAGVDVPHGGRFAPLDLTGLYVSEGQESIVFRLQVADINPDNRIQYLEGGGIIVEFVMGDGVLTPMNFEREEQELDPDAAADQYAIEMRHDDGFAYAILYRFDVSQQEYVRVDYLEFPDVDTSLESWIITVPRNDLLDSQGASIRPGTPLREFYARSIGNFYGLYFLAFQEDDGAGYFDVYDQMPDDGVPAGLFEPELGVHQTGHLRLDSPAPVRASNGEATTYVYDITMWSNADFMDDVNLHIVGAPDSWEVKLPADSVRLGNSTYLHMPVLVTTPFGHEHGSFESFVVEARSARDPSAVGRVELGVRYTEIPQPAGHHSTLWLHSREGTSNELARGVDDVMGNQRIDRAYFNAAEPSDDDGDAQIQVRPNDGTQLCFQVDAPTCMQYHWYVPLEPTLQMGLDFDINGTGELEIPFKANHPMQDVTMEAELYYSRASAFGANDPQGSTNGQTFIQLGTFAETEPLSISTGQTATFTSAFTPSAEADFIPYDPLGASMWMEIHLTSQTSATTIFADGALLPTLAPGGEMTLPLNEYHDPVDDLYNQLTDVAVTMESEQEQYVNSGETVLFEVRIENTGVVNDEFSVAVSGHNDEWATLLGDTTFSIRSHESRRIVVAVSPPLATNQGDTADLVLEAVSVSDSNARALVRLYAEVDNTLDYDDQSHLVPMTDEELRNTPVGAWIAPLAMLGALLLRRRH